MIVNYFSDDIANNVPKMFQILAACWVVMGYLAILIIKIPNDMLKKDLSLKSTHIDIHCSHNRLSRSEANIDFHERHTYTNNLYFGMGGLIKSKSYQPVHETNSPNEIKKIKIEMQNIEKNKDSSKKKHDDLVNKYPITLKKKISVASNPEKMHPFQDEEQDHPHTLQDEDAHHTETELKMGILNKKILYYRYLLIFPIFKN